MKRALAIAGVIAATTRIALAQPLTVVRVGMGITEGYAQAFYAQDQGLFRKNGIDAQFTFLRSGNPIMEAVVAGQLDVGSSNSVSVGSAILRSIPFRVLAAGQLWLAGSPEAAIVVAANAPIKSFGDLAGKTVGTISLRNVGELAFDAYLDRAGIDPATVKFVELAPLQTAEAVAAGRVAAGSMVDPELSSAVNAGKVRRFAPAYDAIAKEFYLTVWFASADWLARNPETARRFADALIGGGAWGEANPERAAAVLGKFTKVIEPRATAHFRRRLDPALLQALWTPAYKYKIFNAPLRAADYCWSGA
jgi:NitT/TauT family transport system substrate-binding protein